MSLRSKIWAAMAAVGVVPLLLLGMLSFRTSRDELVATVSRLQAQTAAELARGCERAVGAGAAHLALTAGYVPWSRLSREELASVLAIPYRQLADVAAIALVDAKGDAVVPPFFESHPERYPELAGREPLAEQDLDLFARSIPLKAALASGVAVGSPHRLTGRGPRVALAARVPDDRVIAVELSLGELQRRLDALAREGQVAYLLDATGALVTQGGAFSALEPGERSLIADGLEGGQPTVRSVARQGEPWLAAFAPVSRLGWAVVAAQPAATAFRAAQRVRDVTLLWAGLAAVITVVVGALLARGLTQPIAALSQATAAAARGEYRPADGADGYGELSPFAQAFNKMIEEIQRRDAAIGEFNAVLKQRVEERTAELRQAQDQIMRTRRMAALGSLGAGVAHELNNPLTALLGHLALAKRSLGAEGAAAGSIQEAQAQAQRMARIVKDLRQVTSQEQASAGQRFPVARPIRAALEALAQRLGSPQLRLTSVLPEPSPQIQGDPAQIEQLVAHLVRNAANAMPQGGLLEVGTGTVEGEAVKLWVKDSGRGIPEELRERIFDPFFSTKDVPGQIGLGLSLCHAIAEAHHATIHLETAVGKGTTFTVLFPAAAPKGHLL